MSLHDEKLLPKLSRHELIAKKAIEYSRHFIKTGATELAFKGSKIDDRFNMRIKGVNDLREEVYNEDYILKIDSDLSIGLVDNINQISKKFSIGNCQEYALMALEYVVLVNANIKNPQQHVNAELYHFSKKPGDHVFLVIGREPTSDPANPDTWGKDAYICDPWSDKTYLASDYINNLKSYRKGSEDHSIVDFSPEIHSLEPLDSYNTETLKERNSEIYIEGMYIRYQKKINQLKHKLMLFKDELVLLKRNLKDMHGENDPKYLIIQGKIEAIEDFIKNSQLESYKVKLPDHSDSYNPEIDAAEKIKQDPYHEIKHALQDLIKKYLDEIKKIMQFKSDDVEILFKPRTVLGRLFEFAYDSNTKHALNSAFQHFNESLNYLSDYDYRHHQEISVSPPKKST